MFDRRGEVEPVALRLATVFGLSPRMRFDLVVNTLTAHAVVDGRIAIFGGNQWRPNVHCRDAARAFAIALQAPAAAVAGEIFNVGGDRLNHRIQDLGTMVAQIVGDVAVDASADVADPRDYRVSFQKIRRLLGFEPEFSVADGIREVAEAVRSDSALRRHRDAGYHNVQAVRQQRSARPGGGCPWPAAAAGGARPAPPTSRASMRCWRADGPTVSHWRTCPRMTCVGSSRARRPTRGPCFPRRPPRSTRRRCSIRSVATWSRPESPSRPARRIWGMPERPCGRRRGRSPPAMS